MKGMLLSVVGFIGCGLVVAALSFTKMPDTESESKRRPTEEHLQSSGIHTAGRWHGDIPESLRNRILARHGREHN
jgi:hypothetical protein